MTHTGLAGATTGLLGVCLGKWLMFINVQSAFEALLFGALGAIGGMLVQFVVKKIRKLLNKQ